MIKRSNEVKITERAVRLELSLHHRPDAILNLGGLFGDQTISLLVSNCQIQIWPYTGYTILLLIWSVNGDNITRFLIF